MGSFYSRINVLRHNCAYSCGGIRLTPHWEPPWNRAGASEPIGARDPPDPRHGKAPALGRGRPPGLGQRGLSIPEEPNKPSYRQRAGGVADRSGYSAPRRRPTIARSVDGRDASTAQDVQKWQDSLHSELMYKRLEAGVFKLPHAEGTARAVELRASELAMILDGIDVSRLKRVPRYERPAGGRALSG